MTVWAWLMIGFGSLVLLYSVAAGICSYRDQFKPGFPAGRDRQDPAASVVMFFIPFFIVFVLPFLLLHLNQKEHEQAAAWRVDCESVATVLDLDWRIITEPTYGDEVCMYRVDGVWRDRERIGPGWWIDNLPDGVSPILAGRRAVWIEDADYAEAHKR